MQNDFLESNDKQYDVVIVGAGISGAILAKELGKQGKSVLILEAGPKTDFSYTSYLKFVDHFYTANAKTPASPYPANTSAPQPDVIDPQAIQGLTPDTNGYFVQKGPLPFLSTYTRYPGGTMLHWLGTCLRMLPEDFEMRSKFGQGLNWPITYEELQPYYEKAENEIGVSADVEDQKELEAYLGITFSPDYVFPMHKVPQSYLDKHLQAGLQDMKILVDGEEYPLLVTSTPQGRNSIPNENYVFEGKKGYEPVGAVGNPQLGQRCEGNTSCVPICPVQAKYNGLKTLKKAVDTKYVKLRAQAVASQVNIDTMTGRVTSIEYKAYPEPNSSQYTTHLAKGKIYVLAAHAVENAKVMLASGLTSMSGLVGKNLMDHPDMVTWGLMPEPIGSFRGPLSTSGIETLRGGSFRQERAAFRIEIGNEGWNWSANSPYTFVSDLVDNKNLFGSQLINRVKNTIPRQFRLGFLVEQLPETSNRVTIDPNYRDALGNYRPVISYNLSDYTKAGLAAAKKTSDLIFQRLGVEDYTSYNEGDPGFLNYQGQGYSYYGAGHLGGTHIMGLSARTSVVDRNQRAWDHDNLYLVGCGSMPTLATSNPTLTMAAMAFMTAESILEDLRQSERVTVSTSVTE